MRISGYATFDITPLVGDGQTDNTAFLQMLIDGGDIISLPPGIFLTGPLTMKSGTHFRGVGAGTFGVPSDPRNMTILKPIPGINADLLVGPPGTADVKLCDFQIDMTGNTGGRGIVLQDGNSEEAQWKLKRLYLHHVPGIAVYIGTQRRCVHLSEVVINRCLNQGIQIKGSDAVIDQCTIGQNAKEGIVILDAVARINNCDIFWNLAGIAVAFSWGALISGNSIDRNMRHGVYIDPNTYGVSLVSNVFNSNSQELEGGFAHIDVNAAKQIAALGNIFGPSAPDAPKKPSYCVYMRPGASVAGMDTNVMRDGAALYGYTNLSPEEW